ncbi:hypothetical protein B7494_g584 [Chlorociboria aeruginascens]|nr:hypothetical protein B7494_g584 [Chlorociboria aeruginascens]
MTTSVEDRARSDTIVIKGEKNWSRPSTPISTTPEFRPEPHTLLSPVDSPRHLESPEPLPEVEGETPITNPDPDSEQPILQYDTSANPALRRQRYSGTSTMEERLQMMPERRPMPWRPGVEHGADLETVGESRRKQIIFGCLLATRGNVVKQPCNTCANGRGKFNVCVALDGYFKGACASCQLSGRPNRCSIKKNDDVKEARGDLESPSAISSEGSQPASQREREPSAGDPLAKRRRIDAPTQHETDQRAQWDQKPPVMEIRSQTNGAAPQPPWPTVNGPMSLPNPNLPAMSNGSRHTSHNSFDRDRPAWAAVNQPILAPIQQLVGNGQEPAMGDPRNESRSIIFDGDRREETFTNEERPTALIETMPKNKQRQIYGLVSGIQGGIEHLQRELDTLKKALGIDD